MRFVIESARVHQEHKMARYAMQFICCLVIAFAVIGTFADEPERIVNGVNTSIERHPFAVSLRINNNHFCCGSIIGKRHIITAAHCITPIQQNRNKATVVSGTTYLNSGGQHHQIRNTYYHPRYNAQSGYDLGIIELANDIQFSNVQRAIPLPSCGRPIPQGSTVTVVAWGTTYFRGPVSNVLQELNAAYLPPNECQKRHNSMRISPTEFCTYVGPSIGTCNGDSGAGVLHNGQIIGCVSKGIPCARGLPDVKTDICSLMDWVRSIVRY